MKKLILIFSLIYVVGCTGSRVSQPFCTDTLSEFPQAYWGAYESLSPMPNSEFNNAYSYRINHLEVVKEGIRLPAGDSSFVVPPLMKLSNSNICGVDGSIYLEMLSGEGGYEVIRMEVSTEGLHFAPLAFDPETLKKNQINFFVPAKVTPVLHDDPTQMGWNTETIGFMNTLLFDNRTLSARDVLKYARFSSLRMSYNRVQTRASSGKPTRLMTLKNYKNLRKTRL